MDIARYALRRILQALPALLAVVLIEFALVHTAPGNVAQILAGEDQDPDYIKAVEHRYGLDESLLSQLGKYLGQLLHGNLGTSFTFQRPVLSVVVDRAPATLALVVTALVIASVAGTACGAIGARTERRSMRAFINMTAVTSYSIPVFWLGLVLILVFGVQLGWLPTSGMTEVGVDASATSKAIDFVRHLALPALTLSALFFGQFARLARSSVADILSRDYVTLAVAMGYSKRAVTYRFALRNSLVPVVTLLGIELGLALSGALLTETVFAWPGIGSLVYQAIVARDIPLVIGIYTAVSVMVITFSILTDIACALIDPRGKHV